MGGQDGCNKEFVKVSGEDGRGIIFPYGYVSTESNQFGWHCDNNGDVAVNVTLATTSDDVSAPLARAGEQHGGGTRRWSRCST